MLIRFFVDFFIAATADLLGSLFAERAGGLEQQDDDQQREGEGVGERGVAQRLDEVLADADDERADDCAGDRADAAEHRGDERLEAGHCADGRRDGGVVGEIQHGADSRQQRADDECSGDDGIDLDAHQLRGFKVLGHGAHGHADLGLLDQGYQSYYEHDGKYRSD